MVGTEQPVGEVKIARYVDRAGTTRVGTVDADQGVIWPVAEEITARDGQQLLLDIAMTRRAPRPIGPAVRLEDSRLLAPVPEPPSIRDFYAFEDHVATAARGRGRAVPSAWYEVPVFYFSNPAMVLGPDDPVWAPVGSCQLDYELEVAAVVGVDARGAAAVSGDGCSLLAGFCVMNDWSARDVQATEMSVGLGPAKGKDFATSLGPWLVTPDEFTGTDATMTATVDGVEWSRGELSSLYHPWSRLLAQAVRDSRLRPGDVVGTGTVGTGCILELSLVHGGERFPWLRPGQRVALTVEGIGTLRNPVVERT